LFLAYPNTFTAKDTLVGIEREDGEAVIDEKVSFELPESVCPYFDAQVFSDLQEFTGTAF
jgi:hypothetical protein